MRRIPAWAVLLFTVCSGAAHAQLAPPPLTTAPCVPTKKDPCPAPAPAAPAETFPFPGETPNDLPGAPGDASSPGSKGSSAPASAQSASSPSSSSSSSSSSASPPADPEDTEANGPVPVRKTAPARRKLPKVEDLDERERKDLEVSRYYASTGNHLAAYLRAKDAVTTMPDDPEAHFQLARTAAGNAKPDEAFKEYAEYLRLDADGDHARESREALVKLGRK